MCVLNCFFFFKQKTAYEMRISDWSSDVCSSDLMAARAQGYPDIVAPPSFPAVIETLANDEQRRRGELPLTEVIGCDFHHLLHGEQHFTYEGLMYAGDDVVVTTRVEDFYRSEEHTSELQSLMRISYAVFCLKKKK